MLFLAPADVVDYLTFNSHSNIYLKYSNPSPQVSGEWVLNKKLLSRISKILKTSEEHKLYFKEIYSCINLVFIRKKIFREVKVFYLQ